MDLKVVSFSKANDNIHKFEVVILNKKTNKEKTIKFGAFGMSDYTQHHDDKRKDLYDARHIKRENWADPLTAGFWSKWVLWNKKTIRDSLADTIKRFNLSTGK
jgi:hypothetical protein